MRSVTYIGSLSLLARLAVSDSFVVFNNQGVCRIWSDSVFGCTGYSEPFAVLNGDDCSNFSINGTSTDAATLKLDICGTENGRQVAWMNVTRGNGSDGVSFRNQQGKEFCCLLDNNFKVGSKCIIPHLGTQTPIP
ncbi:hypothetical protein N7509_003894 [Penicillium cosmopolitanum]|uniref:Cyanovirin-N domain-containing protein n=1 Tax=Penicillium cosmopolitanum TaxID=1131564 RepID=A0A9X0BBX2_9EURO|nr:uncharacterized protein N7509_003894 [Penicillium cosmopolitanum]KAJ5404023.1 hypothetical protein N7509_003894 [Penicillium cosmopolitanum]